MAGADIYANIAELNSRASPRSPKKIKVVMARETTPRSRQNEKKPAIMAVVTSLPKSCLNTER